MTRRGCGVDRGSGVVQLPLMAIVFVAFIAVLVFVGRVNSSYAAAESAARYSARTISIARDPVAAAEVARAEAEDTVGVGSANCATMDFSHRLLDDRVEVTVTCVVNLSDVGLVGIPADWTVTATVQEPLDVWREGR